VEQDDERKNLVNEAI